MERFERESSVAALENLANALNSCEKKNLDVKLRHGIVITDAGFVMPIKDKWVARMLMRP